MVKQIVCLQTKLQVDAFRDFRILIDRKINRPESRSEQGVPSQGSEMSRSRHALGRSSTEPWPRCERDRETAQVKKMCRVTVIVFDRSDDIWPAKKLATSVEVV